MRPLTTDQKAKMKKALLQKMTERDSVSAGLADLLLDRAGEFDKFKDSVKEMISEMVEKCEDMLESHIPIDGITPIKGHDYLTDEEIESFEEELCKKLESHISAEIKKEKPDLEGLKQELLQKIESSIPVIPPPVKGLDTEDVTRIVKKMLPPKLDEEALLRKAKALMPKQKDIDIESVIKDLILGKKVTIPQDMVEGLEATLRSMWSQIGNGKGKGYVHGGGDTIRAGSNVTVTRNADGTVTVSASSGGVSTFTALTDTFASYTGKALEVVRVNAGETALETVALAGGGDALKADPLSQFAQTTSLQLKDTISDETGSGALVFANAPTLIAPALGTPASGVATNLTGTATALNIGGNAATVTTNANLTGPVTSVGNATAIADAALSIAKTSGLQTALDAKAIDADVVHDTGNETIAGVKTFSSDPLIPDEAYGVGWNGSLEPATKNAIYDKIEAIPALTDGDKGDIAVSSSGSVWTVESIGGLPFSPADAGADAIFGWDDSAGAYENLTQAEARTVLGIGTAGLVATDLADLNEATIEGAIDTLANLTSIQGRTVTLADAGADALLGWDDSASAYQNLSGADAILALGVTASAAELNHVDGVTSAIQTQLDAKAPLASPTFTGTVGLPASTLTGNQNIAAVPASDHTANGPTTSIFNLGATIALMDLVYLGSSSKWLLTDADAEATASGMLGICLDGGADTDTTTVALAGSFVRDDTWNWTPGDQLYIDTATPGAITATPPSGEDDVRRVIGYAVTADVIYFSPQLYVVYKV